MKTPLFEYYLSGKVSPTDRFVRKITQVMIMLKIGIVTALVLFISIPCAQARDVAVQQTGYNNALQRMESAEVEYKSDAQAVADTEKVIERKKRQLADEQKKAEISKEKHLQAKEKLEQAQVVLDKAWKD